MDQKGNVNNRSNQLNPNNRAYWEARGWTGRPSDWKERVARESRTRGGAASGANQSGKPR